MPGPRGICYECQRQIDLAGCIPDAEARGALLAIAEAVGGELGRVAVRYVALFGPAKSVMGWGPFRQRTQELGALIAAGAVSWDDVTRPATPAMWREGMEIILGKPELRRPLANHNLLRTIVFGIADKQDAQQERERHQEALKGAHMQGRQTKTIGGDQVKPDVGRMRELGSEIRWAEREYATIAARDPNDPRLAGLERKVNENRAELSRLKAAQG